MTRFLLAVVLALPLRAQTPDDIEIIYPHPAHTLRLVGAPIYLIGTIPYENAELTVNDAEALIDSDGAFIAYAEPRFRDGKVAFDFEIARAGETAVVPILYEFIPAPATLPDAPLRFDDARKTTPLYDQTVRVGETVRVEVKATPGARATFTVEGVEGEFPMVETTERINYLYGDAVFGAGFTGMDEEIGGVYQGAARILEPLDSARVSVRLEKNGERIDTTLEATISTLDSRVPRIVRTKELPNWTTARTKPGLGYLMFIPGGVPLEVTGRTGEYLASEVAAGKTIHVPASFVVEEPLGTPPPEASIDVARISDAGEKAIVEFGFDERVPYSIEQLESPQRLVFRFFNVWTNIDWIRHERDYDEDRAPFVREATWSQPRDGEFVFTLLLDQKTHWGYKTEYDGSTLRATINKPAKRRSSFLGLGSQLEGRHIAVDPGHNPESGAVGPRGTLEKDVDYVLAERLREAFEERGAIVELTRERDEELPLRERKARVNEIDPEIVISVHNNAVPQGVDATTYNGSSTYYYYRQAKPLAELIHRRFNERLGLRDHGFYYGNLYMCRIPESISLLVEPAFMSIPEQERLLTTDEFQEKIVEAIVESFEEFYDQYAE
jgi:N-acetylmuramoyl-L-alanine amidase